MRLFVALTPPAEAIAELERVVAGMRGRYPGLRWTDAGGWHLTLVFLGEVGDDVRAVLEPRLARVASRHPAVPLRLVGGGRFGDRVLWVGIDGERHDKRELAALAAGTRRAAVKSGISVDDRPWHGHVTLARAGRKPGREARDAAADLASFAGADWTANRLHLVRSVTGAGPPRYQDVGSWQLRGS